MRGLNGYVVATKHGVNLFLLALLRKESTARRLETDASYIVTRLFSERPIDRKRMTV